jgi:tRNA A37 threonylcarbamoyltransferase TsaD
MTAACQQRGVDLFIPAQAYATDNAAMIDAAGWHQLDGDGPTDPHFGAEPSLRFGQL